MGRLTESIIRRRAEHNEYMLSTLEEVALHQQNLERIELLGQLCPKLKILYLQNNLISKIENLHKLKDLQYLNLALNNISKVQNLQRCESLAKLDLTVNFIPLAGLLSIASLADLYNLKEVYFTGNPCTDWAGYRPYVVATLPQLQRLDGQEILRSERIRAQQQLPQLHQQLLADLTAAGIDPVAAAAVEDDSMYDPDQEVAETGYLDPETGEMKRPWCAATRILEHREQEAATREAEQRKAGNQTDPFAAPVRPRLEDFPPAPADGVLKQKNEGDWEFTLDESDDGSSLVLEVGVGKYLDTSLIKTELQPRYVRLLIKGRLLQLNLPVEVCPDSATAQRSRCSGKLVITMPKEAPDQRVTDVTHLRPKAAQGHDQADQSPRKAAAGSVGGSASSSGGIRAAATLCAPAARTKAAASLRVGSDSSLLRAVQRATVQAAADDSDDPPDL